MAQSGEGIRRVLMVGPEAKATPLVGGAAALPLRYGGVGPMGAEPSVVGALTSVTSTASGRLSLGEVS
jgi:hypothetical protein